MISSDMQASETVFNQSVIFWHKIEINHETFQQADIYICYSCSFEEIFVIPQLGIMP